MSVVTWKVIRPNKLKSKAMIKALTEPIEETIQSADTEFAKTYATWEHKPKFIQKFQELTKLLRGSTTTNPKGSKSNPYPFVTRGTKVRRAVMSSNFSPKTKTRIIGSSGGKGGVIFIGKNINQSGIKAREFEEEIAELEEPKFFKRGKKAIRQVVIVSGQAI